MADLVDVPTEELVKEMQRRLSCQSKPEKHVILIGTLVTVHSMLLFRTTSMK